MPFQTWLAAQALCCVPLQTVACRANINRARDNMLLTLETWVRVRLLSFHKLTLLIMKKKKKHSESTPFFLSAQIK